ncbi:hypothetical protein RSOLAG1IB_08661 [Rhizoctonia solani AG-1 IB]|uniref:Transmembrane protein n=1 Tax=Thanatephorus cucumeris (strain AG1-IB / isolate 7/3/14) TaxID=1108050 RepID=A0A0B7FLP4_THACB|nr:hypothetical protein RSOLAG1IB_08661 [Rhizoctonia solani AG-1 IB]
MSRYFTLPQQLTASPKLFMKPPTSSFYDPPPDTSAKLFVEGAPTNLRSGPDYKRPRLSFQAKMLIPTLIVFVMTTGAGISLTTWLFSKMKVRTIKESFQYGYILADEGSREIDGSASATFYALTAASFISTFINATSPVLMMLISYRIAHLWIRSQLFPADPSRDAGPTPVQYGMLVEVLGSPSILSLGTAVYYLARHRARASAPHYFWKAVTFGVVVYLITHLVGLADTWLHATTSAVLHNLPSTNNSLLDPPLYANLAFNSSYCEFYPSLSCATGMSTWAPHNPALIYEGLNVVSNSSLYRRVITLKDSNDLAIIIPPLPNKFETATFNISSVGVRAHCESLSTRESRCFRDNVPSTINCVERGIKVIPANVTAGPRMLFPNLVATKAPQNLWIEAAKAGAISRSPACCVGNPAESVVQLSWVFGEGYDEDPQPNPAVLTVPAGRPLRIFAACNLTVYNITASYDGTVAENRRWSLVEGSDVQSTPYFADAILAAYAMNLISDHAAINIKSRAMSTNSSDEVMTALSQEISRLALGMTSGLFYFTPASNVTVYDPIILGHYELAPLLAFVFLLFIYGLIALVIFSTSFHMHSSTVAVPRELRHRDSTGKSEDESIPELELVRLRLSSPIPAFVQVFTQPMSSSQPPGPNDPDAQSVSQSIIGFLPEVELPKYTESRLRFGLEDTELRPRFGVWSEQVMKAEE